MFRQRSRGLGQSIITARRISRNGSTVTDDHTWSTTLNDREIMNDVITDNFHARIARGEIINNPLYITLDRMTESPSNGATWSYIPDPALANDYLPGYWTGIWLDQLPPNTSADQGKIDAFMASIPSLITEAKQKAVANIDATPYAFMEDLAELTSTVKTLGSPLASANKAALRFQRRVRNRQGFFMKRSKLNLADATAKAVADAWLSSMYEFRPIMYSLSDILTGLPKVRTRPKRMKARGVIKTSQNVSGNYGCAASNLTWTRSHDHTVKIKAWILYTMAQSRDYIDYDLGLRLKDVPKTAWALVPMSFVYDRFVDITKTIEGIINLLDPRLTILSAGVNVDNLTVVKYTCVATPPSGYSGGNVYGGIRENTTRYYGRDPWIPTYADTTPILKFREPLSDLSNVLDIASLVTQRLRIPKLT